jgi:hypothetical protein
VKASRSSELRRLRWESGFVLEGGLVSLIASFRILAIVLSYAADQRSLLFVAAVLQGRDCHGAILVTTRLRARVWWGKPRSNRAGHRCSRLRLVDCYCSRSRCLWMYIVLEKICEHVCWSVSHPHYTSGGMVIRPIVEAFPWSLLTA